MCKNPSHVPGVINLTSLTIFTDIHDQTTESNTQPNRGKEDISHGAQGRKKKEKKSHLQIKEINIFLKIYHFVHNVSEAVRHMVIKELDLLLRRVLFTSE